MLKGIVVTNNNYICYRFIRDSCDWCRRWVSLGFVRQFTGHSLRRNPSKHFLNAAEWMRFSHYFLYNLFFLFFQNSFIVLFFNSFWHQLNSIKMKQCKQKNCKLKNCVVCWYTLHNFFSFQIEMLCHGNSWLQNDFPLGFETNSLVIAHSWQTYTHKATH